MLPGQRDSIELDGGERRVRPNPATDPAADTATDATADAATDTATDAIGCLFSELLRPSCHISIGHQSGRLRHRTTNQSAPVHAGLRAEARGRVGQGQVLP